MKQSDSFPPSKAEKAFQDAFDRLKRGKPNLLPKGTKVTQNNVAREAGVDPSALRKSRFPLLVASIQSWLTSPDGDAPSRTESALKRRAVNRTVKERLAAVESQRDQAISKLVQAESRIVELTNELNLCKSGENVKVVPFRSPRRGR